MDLSQYRALFLTETREHLNNMNRLVVTLEQEPGNRKTIDFLFREAHSIKGMAATMGFANTATLAHYLEGLLEACRATGEMTAAAVDRLLTGIDLLEILLEDLCADRPESSIDEFIERPTPLQVDVKEPGPSAALAHENPAADLDGGAANTPPDSVSGTYLTDPLGSSDPEEQAGSAKIFQIVIDLIEETSIPATRGLLLLRELDKLGDVLSTQPDVEMLRSGTPCSRIKAWFRASVSKGHLEDTLKTFAEVKRIGFVEDRRKEQRQTKVSTVRVRTDLMDQFVNLAGELITHRYFLEKAASVQSWAEMNKALDQTGRLIDDLHHNVMQARLMPLETVTGRLPRIARDLARKNDKQIMLNVVGAEVGIDRVVLEQLGDPLIHLVRNAIDHGIVDQGTITITACREKDLVRVEVADDGKGMDPGQIRKKALDMGLLTHAQAEHMSDRDALMLICQPGFSTMATVTEVSGRGVGMDIVKAAVENLGGSLDIESAPGQGARFQMRLPLSIAIIKILVVDCAGQSIAIPVTRVLRNLALEPKSIIDSGHQQAFEVDEELVTLVALGPLLGLCEPHVKDTAWVVTTEIHGRQIGLQVDRVLGQRDAFVNSLNFPLNQLPGLSGATIEGDGRILFIVDPHALLERDALVTAADQERYCANSTPDARLDGGNSQPCPRQDRAGPGF